MQGELICCSGPHRWASTGSRRRFSDHQTQRGTSAHKALDRLLVEALRHSEVDVEYCLRRHAAVVRDVRPPNSIGLPGLKAGDLIGHREIAARPLRNLVRRLLADGYLLAA